MSKPAGRCIFCDREGDLTRQHVFPDRIRHLVPRTGTGHTFRSNSRIQLPHDVKVSRAERNKNGDIGNLTVRKVCSSCNGGWMREAEEAAFVVAEPLISGKAASLTSSDQSKLTKLALIICLVAEMADRDVPASTLAERQQFFQTEEPPEGWFVFVGRNGAPYRSPAFFRRGASAISEELVTGPRHLAVLTTVIGQMILQTVVTSPRVGLHPDLYAAAHGIARIWPTTTGVEVVALPLLDKGEVETLIQGLAEWLMAERSKAIPPTA